MNAKKAKSLRRIVRHCIENHTTPNSLDKLLSLVPSATDKQISRAFDVVLGTRNFRSRSSYMIAAN